ncbi:hypothetical protein K490DRAFT_65602 [Saccharata proteae CBS 121410]|uniref:Uncharacterized protein n=1 Tax=Saccharata proteae CBS 121410 TaxID=1314787 RepID=A0A9P4M0C0_9PEZI|nr:hypothetical protein K490DRAFT_65602 [Saccharata proteae CBS 121410]
MRFLSSSKAQDAFGILLVTVIFVLPTAAIKLDDLFHVKSGTDKGDCDSQKAIIQDWLNDTNKLTKSANDAVDLNNWKTDKFIRRNMASFFQIKSDSRSPYQPATESRGRYDSVSETFQTVQDFLNQKMERFIVTEKALYEMMQQKNGNGADDSKPIECLDTTNTAKAGVVENPDSYAFVAWSYYLTKNFVDTQFE